MSLPLLRLAVVGHTNTGKTSLLRTLTRNVDFGEVSPHPATTRHVEGTSILLQGAKVLELYDTPGLEDSIGLLDHLDGLAKGRRDERLEDVHKFLDSRKARGRFAQEAKAIRQVLDCDAALYVIDARDRVLGKHRDELEILARCATPVVPVLNFTADPDAK
ncbi:MAG: GTPase domain-containing protein, partial [Planctomycetota bacterium]